MPDTRPILLIEDDRVDVMTVERALRQLRVPNQLVRTTNGEQALEYLKNENNELPCVILMDLNTPKMNGMEFLQIIKTQESLKDIPIVVMSTSDERQDIDAAAQFGIVKYLVKSLGYEKFVEALSTIEQLWSSPELPPGRILENRKPRSLPIENNRTAQTPENSPDCAAKRIISSKSP